MIPISSSVIKAIDYNSANRTLLVKFASGKTYTYSGVPEQVVRGLVNASSAGRYFNDHIKNHYR